MKIKWPGLLSVLLLISIYWAGPVHAQRNNFQAYSLDQGLPQATIYCIVQDRFGYLWLGTDGGGLCRFDGIQFRNFGKKEGFTGQSVRSMLIDRVGNLWIGTKDEGIIIYDGHTFKNLKSGQGLSGSAILALEEDKDGKIWAGTDDGGVNIISPPGVHSFKKDTFLIKLLNEDNGLSSNSVLGIHKDRHNNMWLATFGGVNVLVPQKDTFLIEHLRGGRDISSDLITSIAEDADGGMWLSTYDAGAIYLSPPAQTQDLSLNLISRKARSFNKTNGFDAKTVWKVYAASNGEKWFSSVEEGVIRLQSISTSDSVYFKIQHYTDRDGLPGNQMLTVFEDSENNIWIGSNGGGLVKFMGDMFAHYNESDGLPGNNVYGMDMDSTGTLWFGTSGGGLASLNLSGTEPICKNYTDKDGLSGNTVLAVSVGKSGTNKDLWLAVSNAGASQFDGRSFRNFNDRNGLLDNSVYSLCVDANGIVWIGSKDGINRWDGVKFINIDTEHLMMSDKDVNAIIQDKRGHLWFGTGGGLARYSGDGSLVTFDEVEGLMHKEIKSLAEDPFGNIWIGTSNGGLYRFNAFTDDSVKIQLIANDSLLSSNSIRAIVFLNDNPNAPGKQMVVGTDKGMDKITFDDKGRILEIRNYNASDGFIGVECNDNSIYRDKDGNVWLGTVKGLTRFNPMAEKISKTAPSIQITGAKLFFKEVDWKARGADSLLPWFGMPVSLELPYSDNHLTFSFAAISLDNPQKVVYRYMLEGADEEWSPDRKETSVTFSGLSPGKYTFKVIAAGANGIWNKEPATFSFVIHPPWYRTTTAFVLYLLILIVGIYSFVKYRERALQMEKKVLEDKVAERTAEVVKQKEIIEEKNKDITDSINYAQKIQRAILPEEERIKKALPDSFILFQPKDVVSGDFYWFTDQSSNGERKCLIAACDCTGHGVPGAFMSMINTSLMNEAMKEGGAKPNEILNAARRGIIRSLKQKGEVGEQKDGMDVALVSLRFSDQTVNAQFAGANNSMYIIRKSDKPVLEEVDPDPMPVAISDRTYDFKNNDIELKKGDCFYLFTDGYADQFGGPKGKKFKYSQFKKLLLSMFDKPMTEQGEILKKTMEEWKGELEQIDDILVIGVRV